MDAFFRGPRPLFIDRLALPPAWRVLVLAPHPDDFEEAGVTLRHLHARGHALRLAVVSGSASGVEDAFAGTPDPAVKARLREEEQRAGLRFFGLGDEALQFLRLPEDAAGDPVEDAAASAAIGQLLAAVCPTLVLLPHGDDPNAGHRRTWRMFDRAARRLGRPLAAWLLRDPKTRSCRMDLVMPFDESAARWKGALLRCHRSQHARNLRRRGHGIDERVLRVNRATAAELGLAESWAEVFELALYGVGGELPAPGV